MAGAAGNSLHPQAQNWGASTGLGAEHGDAVNKQACTNVWFLFRTGQGAAVLLRSLEPLRGLDAMRELRSAARKGPAKPLKDWQLCNGPSKLCQAFGIDKAFDQRDLTQDAAIWMVAGHELPGEQDVVATTRIGVGNRGEWSHKPLRFYLRGNKFVSVVDKKIEREMAVRGPSPCSWWVLWVCHQPGLDRCSVWEPQATLRQQQGQLVGF